MRLPKFRLFDYTTPGPGVSKDEPEKKGIALFWDLFSRRMWKIISLNATYTVFSIPAFLIHWFMVLIVLVFISSEGITTTAAVTEVLYSTTSITIVLFALFGGGAPTAGMTYVLRQYRNDSHSWLWRDFFSTFKKFFFKATAVFVIDTVILFLLGINFYFYGLSAGTNIVSYLLQGLMVVSFLIFLLMHAYIYPILISYEEKKLWDVYKNSFILAIGKLPVTLASVALCAAICSVISILCFGLIYAIIIVAIIMFAFTAFVNLFITFPTVEKYLGRVER